MKNILCKLNIHHWKPIAGTEWTAGYGYANMVTHALGCCTRCKLTAEIEERL